MLAYPSIDLHDSWLRLLQDIELAGNYDKPYLLIPFVRFTHRNPILENVLPSLLFLRLIALLDEALVLYMDEKGLNMPRNYRNSLYYRIKFLGEKSILENTQDLHCIRDRRNEIAHESSKYADWQELDTALAKIEGEFQHLSLVGSRPNYEFFAERSKMRKSTEAEVILSQDYCYGLKSNGRKVIEVRWTANLLEE